jgi:hypothetical protein
MITESHGFEVEGMISNAYLPTPHILLIKKVRNQRGVFLKLGLV